VAIVQWADLDQEIEGIVAAITADITSERREPGDILVLTHRGFIGERIRDGLRNNGIPAESYFREEELRSDKAREGLAILRLAVSPEDAPALRVVLGIGDATGRSAAYQRLWAFARGEGITPREVLERLAAREELPISVPALLSRYERAQSIIAQLDLEDLIRTIDLLFPDNGPDTEGIRRVAVAALPECASAGDLLEHIVAAVTQEDVPQRPDFVRIMSLHKSKGLTSPSVFVVGVVQGIVPTTAPLARRRSIGAVDR
jgi:DNA helicase-2/ATP-dependent DNA helicase PcrA